MRGARPLGTEKMRVHPAFIYTSHSASMIANADGSTSGAVPAPPSSPARGSSAAAPPKAKRNVIQTIAPHESPGDGGGGGGGAGGGSGGSAEAAAEQASAELQIAEAKKFEENIMKLSRDYDDSWLVVKSYDVPTPAASTGASVLIKILEGTESESREALEQIVAQPRPARPAAPPGIRPRLHTDIAPGAPEPEPEPEAEQLRAPSSDAAAPPAPGALERTASVEQQERQEMAKQFWQFNLTEDRGATLSATMWCHCVAAGGAAQSECSAIVYFTEGDTAEVVLVRESAVVNGEDDAVIGRHPLFELCKVVRGDSDQYLRLEFEGEKGYVLVTRDEGLSVEILEQLDEIVGMGATAAIDGSAQTRLALCDTLRVHHTEANDDEGQDMSEDDILAYFLVFQLDGGGSDEAMVDLADKFCSGGVTKARARTLVMSMDWLYLCVEDYAMYPLPPGQVAPPERPNFSIGAADKQILADLAHVHLLDGPHGTGSELELVFEDGPDSCRWRLLAATQAARGELVGELKAAWKAVFMEDLPTAVRQ